MTVDQTVLPGLAAPGSRAVGAGSRRFRAGPSRFLGQTDDRMALAQGLAIGPAPCGTDLVNFLLHPLPGRAGALAGLVTSGGADGRTLPGAEGRHRFHCEPIGVHVRRIRRGGAGHCSGVALASPSDAYR